MSIKRIVPLFITAAMATAFVACEAEPEVGSDELDVKTIDMKSLRMGRGTARIMKHTRVGDLNRDGFADLVSACRTRDLGLALGEAEICMSGTTVEGQAFEGCDVIDTAPRARNRRSERSQRRL